MAIELNRRGLAYAEYLITFDEIDPTSNDWKAHQPTADEIDKYLNSHYMNEYGQWFLGIDTRYPRDTKEHYIYPHGDLKMVHRSAVESVAKEATSHDIKEAAKKLVDLIDKKSKAIKN